MKKQSRNAMIGIGIFFLMFAALAIFKEAENKGPDPDALAAEFGDTGFKVRTRYIGEEILPPQVAPDFTLIDQNNKKRRLSKFKGKYLLLSFAYTSCADICPVLFSSYLNVETAMADRLGKDLELLFVTLDPQVDTPARLKEVTESLGAQWTFLTGDENDLLKVWKEYKVFRKKNKTSVDHTGLTYLIDAAGLMRIRYMGTPPAKVLLSDLEKVLPPRSQ